MHVGQVQVCFVHLRPVPLHASQVYILQRRQVHRPHITGHHAAVPARLALVSVFLPSVPYRHAHDGQFINFKPGKTPLFSRPQILGSETSAFSCSEGQTTTNSARQVVKESLETGPEYPKETCLSIFTKTFGPSFFLFFFSPTPRISGLTYGVLNI